MLNIGTLLSELNHDVNMQHAQSIVGIAVDRACRFSCDAARILPVFFQRK